MALELLLGVLLLVISDSPDLASRIGNLAVESKRTLDTVRRVEPYTQIYKRSSRSRPSASWKRCRT